MAELRWIKMSLFLILLLQVTATTGQSSFLFVRVGDEVTLSCENVRNDQNKCNGTTWVFSDSRTSSAVELVKLGKIQENAASKSHRLSVTENCSLVIKKVTAEDVGRYTCRQFDKSEQQQGPDSLFHLSVVTMTEHRDTDKVMLNCSVSTHGRCRHTVKWVLNSKDVQEVKKDLNTSSLCNASLHLVNYHHIYTSRYNMLSCEVTEENTRQRFTFPLQLSPEKSGEDNKTSTTQSTVTINLTRTTKNSLKAGATVTTATTTIHGASPEQTVWWWFVIVAVALLLLLIVAVAVIKRKRAEGNKTRVDENVGQNLNPAGTHPGPETGQDTADPGDGVSYASISYIKKTSKARGRGKDDDDGEDGAVIYSTVKASSSSAGASADPSDLYATVSK